MLSDRISENFPKTSNNQISADRNTSFRTQFAVRRHGTWTDDGSLFRSVPPFAVVVRIFCLLLLYTKSTIIFGCTTYVCRVMVDCFNIVKCRSRVEIYLNIEIECDRPYWISIQFSNGISRAHYRRLLNNFQLNYYLPREMRSVCSTLQETRCWVGRERVCVRARARERVNIKAHVNKGIAEKVKVNLQILKINIIIRCQTIDNSTESLALTEWRSAKKADLMTFVAFTGTAHNAFCWTRVRRNSFIDD